MWPASRTRSLTRGSTGLSAYRRPRCGPLEGRQFVTVDGQNVGLVVAAQLLDLPATAAVSGDDLAVVLLSDSIGPTASSWTHSAASRTSSFGRSTRGWESAEPRAPRRSSTTARRC